MENTSGTVQQAADVARRHPDEFISALLADSLDKAAEVAEGLERGLGVQPLKRLERLWQLSGTEVAGAFGVSRQAYSKWLVSGIPSERVKDVGLLDEATMELLANVKMVKIPEVVRREAPNLGGWSLVELLKKGDFQEIRDAVERTFNLRLVQP
jgi:hypothetical protein